MIYVFLLLLLFVIEILYFKIADKYNITDNPNERSSHTKVTLRGGGVIFYIGVLIFFLMSNLQYPLFFVGLTLITVISFADDIKPQSASLRLIIQFSALILMFFQLHLGDFPWYYSIIALILFGGILNAYNFMDGINGITGIYSIVVMGSFWYINNYSIYFVDNRLIYLVLLSLVVFNFFNFRKNAICFAGDVGSISMAFIVVFLLGSLIVESQDFSYIVLLVVYGVEVVLTIIHRIILKENIIKPHRKHLFQILEAGKKL